MRQRSLAHLYVGKVISQTARNDADRQIAEQHFLKAIEYDETRGAYPEPHLEQIARLGRVHLCLGSPHLAHGRV